MERLDQDELDELAKEAGCPHCGSKIRKHGHGPKYWVCYRCGMTWSRVVARNQVRERLRKLELMADAVKPLHESWKGMSREMLLDALAFQGAMSRTLLKRNDELVIENIGLRASLLSEGEADAVLAKLDGEVVTNEHLKWGKMKVDAATTKAGALRDLLNGSSSIQLHRLRVALGHMVESGEVAGRTREQVIEEFSKRTEMSCEALENLLAGS